MRVTALVFGLLLSMSGAAAAQEWDEYTNLQDGFKINFPGQPKVTESTWTSQLNYVLPMRVYSAEKGPRALLGHRRRLQQHRAARHRARQVVSARQRELPRERAGRRSAPATRTTTNEARSSTRRSSCCSVTPS